MNPTIKCKISNHSSDSEELPVSSGNVRVNKNADWDDDPEITAILLKMTTNISLHEFDALEKKLADIRPVQRLGMADEEENDEENEGAENLEENE